MKLSQKTRIFGKNSKNERRIQMRVYDKEFKKEAIKLSYEIGPSAATEQLGIPLATLNT